MVRAGCLQILVSFACVCTSFAIEQMSIGTILEQPESYHLHEVILKGTVMQVQTKEPYIGAGSPCYGAATFTLQDETGMIDVDIPGVCAKPQMQDQPRVSKGDKVVVRAQIHAPGHYYEGGAPPIFGEDRTTVRAVTSELSKVNE